MGSYCAIHQPNLFPRLSTLAKLHAADVWVVLDNVQFTRGAYQQRCRLADTSDPSRQQWLTVPVHLPQGRATQINQVRVADPAATRHRIHRLLQQYYGRGPHWPEFQDALLQVLATLDATDRLADLTEASTRALLTILQWQGDTRHSSQLPARSDRSHRLADLTRAVGASTYLCGTGGARYLDQRPFANHGLPVILFGPPADGDPRIWQAASKVTAIRALMACGPAALTQALHQYGVEIRSAGEPAEATGFNLGKAFSHHKDRV